MTISRQLSAIMFTDIAGYTAMMGKDEEKALAWLRKNREIQKPLIEKHNGKYLKDIGDGILAQFSSAYDSVKCALEIQRQSREGFEGEIKIGIHLGDVTEEGGDIVGDGVNIASRLEAIADPGGIYISESVHKAIRGRGEIISHYLGELSLKNVDYGVKTYAVTGEGQPVPSQLQDKELRGHFRAELKRRNVVPAAFVYIIVGFLITQVSRILVTSFDLPTPLVNIVIIGMAALFPLAMWLAWTFERSPQGFIRTSSKKSWENPYSDSQKKPLTNNIMVGALVVVIAVMYFFPQGGSGSRGSGGISEKSIAVLYFDNMSGDESQEYFSDGVTEEIIAQLSRIQDLKVVSRTSVETYKGKPKNIKAIAAELGVRTILEGSVRRFGDQLKITAQLIDAESDEHLWTEEFEETMDNIFEIQSNVAQTIAEKFDVPMTATREMQINTPPTTNVEAYDLYLKANAIGGKTVGAGLGTYTGNTDQAIKYLKQALELDPGYGQALALLANYYRQLYFITPERPDYLDTAVLLAVRAINNDPDLTYGYIALGRLSSITDGSEAALRWFEKANEIQPGSGMRGIAYNSPPPTRVQLFYQMLEEDPRNIDLYVDIVHMYDYFDQRDSVLYYLDKAEALAPEDPRVVYEIYQSHMYHGDIEKTSKYASVYFEDDSLGFNKEMGILHLFRGEWLKAEEYYAKTNYQDMDVGLLLMKTGREDSGRIVLNNSLQFRYDLGEDRAWPGNTSRILAALGREKEALELLQKEYRSMPIWFFTRDPFLADIRSSPEFQELLNKYQQENQEILRYIHQTINN